MRWGSASAAGASLRWVRPLHSILCTFGPETEEPEIVRFEVDGIASGDVTFGHRFLSDGKPIRVRRLEDYVAKLEAAHVILDADRRRQIILNDARNLAFAQGCELIEDEGLLEEVAGLVEWPTVLMGSFDADFLQIPAEVIRATIRANQKCFVLRDGKGALANRFLLTSNQIAPDGGQAIVAGNERVVRARLSDALHFWKTDQKPLPDVEKLADSATSLGLDLAKPLDQRMARLDALGVVFHEKLGTQGQRVRRIAALARELAAVTGADPELCARAALLAKADLQTKWSASSRSCRASWAGATRSCRASTEASAPPSRIITSRLGPATACRPTPWPSPSRSPTSSTRWSASGPSTRSRPGARTPMRCGGRRWG